MRQPQSRGNFADRLTQQWVRVTGCKVDLRAHSWLDGPAGNPRLIGSRFFEDYAEDHRLEIVRDGIRGLIPNFLDLKLSDPGAVTPEVRCFYEETSEYELDAWSEWSGFFRPFGRALALIFSRRLQQLNVPLSALDSSKGLSSTVLGLRDPITKAVAHTAWVRELRATKNTLYAGAYSTCCVPGCALPCVKVVFPLPNGNAIVLMRPEVQPDGSFLITSSGRKFGDPGFYFTVHDGAGSAWARYVRSMRESIHVYSDDTGLRADHILRLWGLRFLRLHYRMRRTHR